MSILDPKFLRPCLHVNPPLIGMQKNIEDHLHDQYMHDINYLRDH